ncbi:hypothetical protein HDU89_000357 [Geranomyces variabilis]|nr:hypothetical protein HDU89_000357 [Geranomyces variabilis]
MSLSPSPSSPELKRRSSKASVNGSAHAHTATGPTARPPLPSSAATKLLSPASTSQLSNKHNQQTRPSFATLCRSFLAQWKDSGSSLPKRRRKNSAATISFSTASSAAAAMNASASAAAEAEAFYPPMSRGSSSNRSRRPPLPIFTSPAASVSESHLPSSAVSLATSPLSPAVSDVTDTATLVAAGGPDDQTASVLVKESSAQSHQPPPPPPPTAADDQQTASSASGGTSTTTAISLHTYMSSSHIPTPLLEDAVTLEDQLIGLAMLRRTSLASAAAASVVEIAVSLDGTSPVLQAAPPAAVSGGGTQADAAAAASVAESVDDSLPLTAVTTTAAAASDAKELPQQLQVLQQQQPITMVLPPLPPGATVSLNNKQQQQQQPITMVLPPLPPGATVTLNNGLPRPALRWTDDVRDNNNANNPRGVGVPPAVAALKSRPGVTRALSDLRRSLSTLAIKLRSPMNAKDQDEDYHDYYDQDGYFTAVAAGVSPRAAAAAAREGTTTTTTTPAAASPASSPSAQRRRRKRLSSTASPTSPTSPSTKTRSVTNGTSRHSVVIKDVSPESVAEALAPGTSYAQGLASLFDGEKQARDDEDDEDEDFEASELESGDDGRSSDDDALSVCTALHVDDDDEGASASESDKDLPPLPNPAPRLRRSRSEPRLRTSVVSTSSSSVFGRWTNSNNTKNAPSGRSSLKGLLPGASVSTSSLASNGSKTGSSNKPWKQLWKRLNASTTSLAVR